MQDKIQVVASSFETADTLSAETVDQVISVLGDINVSRLLITDGEAKVLYDSSVRQNAVGQYALLEAVCRRWAGATCSTARITRARCKASQRFLSCRVQRRSAACT